MYLLAGLLLLLSWFLPLHVLPWTSWHQEVLVFAAVVLAYAAFLWQEWGRNGLVLPRLAVWFLALAGLVACQGMLGTTTYAGDALVVVAYLIFGIMVLMVGYAQRQAASAATCMALMLVLAGVISTVLALVQALDVWNQGEWASLIRRTMHLRRPAANLGQPNHLATVLLFALAGLAYLNVQGKVQAGLTGFLAIVLLSGLVLTESRTGALGVLLLGGWWWHYQRPSGRSRLVLLGLGAYFLFMALLWPHWFQIIHQEGNGPAQYTSNPVGRLVVWPQLWQAVFLKPWWGWGLRNVSEAHNAVLDAYVTGEPYIYAHNIVLDMAIGMGLPLTVLFLGAAAVWLWHRLRVISDPVVWFGMGMALILVLHSMLEFPFAYAYLLFPVLWMVGMAEARLDRPGRLQIPRGMAAVVFLVASVGLAWATWEYLQVEEDFRVARFEALKIGKTPATYERPQIHLLLQLATMLEASRSTPEPGMSPHQLELARQAALRFPWTALQNRYALSLALNGEPEEAIRQLKVMRAMHGEKHYRGIKDSWETLAEEKYPQLRTLQLP